MTLAELNGHLDLVQQLQKTKNCFRACGMLPFPGRRSWMECRTPPASMTRSASSARRLRTWRRSATLKEQIARSEETIAVWIAGIEDNTTSPLFRLRFHPRYAVEGSCKCAWWAKLMLPCVEDGNRTCGVSPNAAGCRYIEKRENPCCSMSGAGSAAMIYLQNNVFDEALEQLRMIFDSHDDVIVSMSGVKDSTVLFPHGAGLRRARASAAQGILARSGSWWQATMNYMQHIMELPEVTPYWYQIPFEFNTLSPEKNFISVWNPEDKAIWIHPQHRSPSRKTPAAKTGSMSLSTSSRPTAPILKTAPCWWECA